MSEERRTSPVELVWGDGSAWVPAAALVVLLALLLVWEQAHDPALPAGA